MNVLVTGGAGYVGSHTVRLLRSAGDHVVVYDNLVYGHPEALLGAELVVGHLHETDRLAAVMRERVIEAVVHFAAFAYVGESVQDPAKYYRNNVVGTLSLLDAMRAAGVGKVVFSSTCSTYGEQADGPISEDRPQKPLNPYGFTKFVVERVLDDYATAYGLAYAALRYFNAAGASADGAIGEDHTPETHLIPLVLDVALGKRKEILVFGDRFPTPDGTCIRDYIHVEDLATAHQAALRRLGPGSRIRCNLGTGRGTSVLEVIEACRAVTGRPIPHRVVDARPGDAPSLVADARLAREVLGWEAAYREIRPIVETAWNWHLAHPDGYATKGTR
jgi:UDP-glucose-4-epimerase GalE